MPRAPRAILAACVFLFLLINACSDGSVGPGEPERSDRASREAINLVSGGNQPGIDGEFLAEPIVVRVTDEEGAPVPRVPVRFTVIHGNGRVSTGDPLTGPSVDVTTDDEGFAEVRWKLGHLDSEHVLKVYRMRDAASGDTTYVSPALYVFGGMEAEVTVDWISDIEFRIYNEVLPHDNNILETPNFLTFSDASSNDVKVAYAAMAEESLLEIMDTFGISTVEDLGIDQADPSTKITIFTSRYMDQQEQMAFPVGFILYGLDHRYWTGRPPWRYRRIIKHETMHVLQWLIGLPSINPYPGGGWPEYWFTEGIAEHISGGSWLSPPISTAVELETWRAQPYHYNPIAIHAWEDFPDPIKARGGGSYAPMFGLAVRYLLDKEGLGKSYADVLAMFEEMIEIGNFAYSFERYMGISVADYERDFFDLVVPFLADQGGH